jgi:hypothetical protein
MNLSTERRCLSNRSTKFLPFVWLGSPPLARPFRRRVRLKPRFYKLLVARLEAPYLFGDQVCPSASRLPRTASSISENNPFIHPCIICRAHHSAIHAAALSAIKLNSYNNPANSPYRVEQRAIAMDEGAGNTFSGRNDFHYVA